MSLLLLGLAAITLAHPCGAGLSLEEQAGILTSLDVRSISGPTLSNPTVRLEQEPRTASLSIETLGPSLLTEGQNTRLRQIAFQISGPNGAAAKKLGLTHTQIRHLLSGYRRIPVKSLRA